MSRVKFLLPSLLLACLSTPALAGKYCTKLPDASVIGDTKTFYKFDWNYPKGPHTWAMKLVTSYAAWNGDVYYDQEDVPLRTWPKSHARKYNLRGVTQSVGRMEQRAPRLKPKNPATCIANTAASTTCERSPPTALNAPAANT